MNTITTDQAARAAWSAIAEPGDKQAAAAIRSIGADVALDMLRADPASLVEQLGTVTDEDAARAAVDRWMPRQGSAARVLESAARHGVQLITPDHPHWPAQLADLGDAAPWALFTKGDTSHLMHDHRAIATITGARAATGYGEHVTIELAAGLVDLGFAIASGAAYGIDGAAHRAALAARGSTVAFMAGGLDRFYPAGHDALLGRIAERGVVVSEVPCGVAPTRYRFLARNRIAAAFAATSIVVEAGARSGSLNLAGHAMALGRGLGAVPGPITSAASAGCHRLLREFGATCVTSAAEIASLAQLPAKAA